MKSSLAPAPLRPAVRPPAPTPPTAGRITRVRRRLGIALAVVAAVAIGLLTLTPEPVVDAVTFGPTCLVCGDVGGADVVANVILFLPFGAGLALAGVSWRRAALAGALLSIGIETTQHLAVTGRFATLSDVLTNSTGGAIGAALVALRRRWLRPDPREATQLVALGAALFVGALGFGAWGFGTSDAPDATPPRADRVPLPTGLGWFSGLVHRATLDDFATTNRGTGPVTIAAPARHRTRVTIDFTGWDRRGTLVPMLYVHPPAAPDAWLMVGQDGSSIVVVPSYRGRLLRLRRPRVAIAAPDGESWDGRVDGTFTADAEVSSDRVTIGVSQGAWRRANTLRISPTMAWALLSPLPNVNAPLATLATAAWVAGLALPLGYWTRWLARRSRGEAAAAVGILATFGTGLVAVPLAAGYSPARPWEWVAACGGALVGAGAAEVVRRVG